MTTKYSSKRVVNVNENLRIYEYTYSWGKALYYVPRSRDEEVVKVDVVYPRINAQPIKPTKKKAS